jgi:hypothetical protein
MREEMGNEGQVHLQREQEAIAETQVSIIYEKAEEEGWGGKSESRASEIFWGWGKLLIEQT